MSFELPQLPYAYDALEPHIDARTMEIHHSKHHQAYITNLNNAVAGTELEGKSLEELMNVCKDNTPVRNNGGGHWNHTFFWSILSPNGGGEPTGKIGDAIAKSFGSYENFKVEFINLQQHVLVLDGRGCACMPMAHWKFAARPIKTTP